MMIDVQAFWNKIDKSNDCWIWRGACDHRGYGRFHTTYPTRIPHHIGAHRMAYILTHGEVSDDMEVCHTCDNPPCCNPAHLFAATHHENMADKDRKGRGSKPPIHRGDDHPYRKHPELIRYGGKHPNARLTDAQAAEIRVRYLVVQSQRKLAREYGVSLGVIHGIIKGRTYTQ